MDRRDKVDSFLEITPTDFHRLTRESRPPTNVLFVFHRTGAATLPLEPGVLPPAQAALLRVLETKRVRRVGSTDEIAVDVRVLAATHRDLEAMVQAGTFRRDLLYRLNVVTVRVPPLRERPEDIEPLCNLFIEEANRANDRHVRGLDRESSALLRKHDWPGNVRELRNVIERAVLLASGELITVEDLSERVRGISPRTEPHPTPSDAIEELSGGEGPSGEWDFRSRIQRIETAMILEALRASRGNQTLTAQRLRIPPRTLTRKMKAYGIRKLGHGPCDDDSEPDDPVPED